MSCKPEYNVPKTIVLHNNWQFKQAADSVWRTATVPGNVFSDLLQHQLIKDPFIANNEAKVQWVSKVNWDYKTQFKLGKKILQKKHIELNFNGLDTYADVYLNDSLILQSNNAFRAYNVAVKSLLKETNYLLIRFKSTKIVEEKEKAKLNYTLPENNRIFTRKAQFQYGWDWGPKLNTQGIWKAINLTTWDDFKIKDIDFSKTVINNSIAKENFRFYSKNTSNKKLTLEVYINDSLYFNRVFKNTDALKENNVTIKNPKLWWPHNLGDPYLYNYKIVVKQGNTILDTLSFKRGIKTIKHIAKKDSIGESFYFKVNGKPIYAKGANYIPQHNLQNKVTNAHYKKLLNNVVNANMNMLRVWGGGIYEDDYFYKLCDEKGILVWQDFMFACAMYPGDNAFLNNVSIEAEQQVKRLRKHTSLTLFCGNNESNEGWHRWGWKDNRNDIEKDEIWSNYLKVFDSILPQTVSKYSSIDYWESSPKYGRGNPKYKYQGDAHDWWVWHDGYPFEHFEDNVPRFMSEFGFQAFPSFEAIQFINQNDSLYIDSNAFKNHQKHHRGFKLINDYMERDFPVPYKVEDYVYVSQLLQAHGITKGIEAHRHAKPYNMGTLYWQLNDCWPAISWSSIDFFGNWKALHYKAKKAFNNVLISNTIKENKLFTYVVNDSLKPVTDTLSLKLIDFNGNMLFSASKLITARANSSVIKHSINLDSLLFNKANTVLVSNFANRFSYFYFEKPKHLQLPKQNITKKITKTSQGFTVKLSSKTLQKNVFLYTNKKGHFSDNYFDLLPNTTKTIQFKSSQQLDEIMVTIKTLNYLINE